MSALVSSISPSEAISPALPASVWRADQMGSYQAAVVPTGHPALDAQLPNGGWPSAVLIELLLQQAGIGEMRLLRPALRAIARRRRIALLQPPHRPHIAAWLAWGLPAESLLWIRPARSVDALWSAEQVLRNGSCGALLFWQQQVRAESLRRLHLAAQGTDILFWMMRPLACAQDASPSPLRLALHPAAGGIDLRIVKRRGPQHDEAFHLRLEDLPAAPSDTGSAHAHMDRRAPAAAAARNLPAALV
ncbi:MAG TPA: translesion DNA synthesis-associated protein ImuA [Noviherbaspirillum sp.]|uniref:translesion DNA synthesis-associated protein ImuA n=1 Tax=Noviherbaspirillum sp. TaxID=1926288 RepID=UPI002D305DB6|nr:translesion DNA synthesis-associated protein ImuA [Noviherbaspirillum sp.]HYD97305.1 translesion DNA synthesis-associated protein ImuA [Noviherbaspirillum sp.]